MVQRVLVRGTASKFGLRLASKLKKKNSKQNNRKRNSVRNDMHSLGRLQQDACSVWTRVWRSPQTVQESTSQETTERKSPLYSDHRPWQVVKLPPHLPSEVLEQRASDWLSKQKIKGNVHYIGRRMYWGANIVQRPIVEKIVRLQVSRSWRSELTQTLKPHTTDELCVAPMWMKV